MALGGALFAEEGAGVLGAFFAFGMIQRFHFIRTISMTSKAEK